MAASSERLILSDPKFSKSISGDFAFNLECESSRCRSFLLRNIRQLLSYHERNLRHRGRDLEESAFPDFDASEQSSTQELEADSISAKNTQVAITKTLSIRSMAKTMETGSRRSTRKLEALTYDHDEAELTLNLRSIRKLLNFILNRPEESEPPHKKVKRNHFKCQCSLTIWDNRPSLADREAIVKKSVFCSLSSVDNGAYGPCAFIYLDKPFVVRAGELKVPIDRNGEAQLEVVDNYFLEFKIIPTRPDENWPPIPILGKSDGDSYSGEGRLPSEALAGALVMKYKEIPRAPEPNTPLKTFFLYNGITFKTKYGLEVSAEWRRPSKQPDSVPRAESIIDHTVWPDTLLEAPTSPINSKPKGKASQGPSGGDVSLVGAAKPRRRRVRVIYHFEPNTCRAQDVLRQYRTAEVTGLLCPACPTFRAKELQELRFHFLSSHYKYNFALGHTVEDEESGDLREAVFDVTQIPNPKPTSRLIKNEVEFEWVKTATRFDLAAFLDGDSSWLGLPGEEIRVPVRRAFTATANVAELLADPLTDRRSQNGGYLASNDVREFRKPARKRHRTIKLIRRIDDRVATYTSISHKQTFLSEEAMSETDDEVEDEWFIQQHLENLEIVAKEEDWDLLKRELFRRWDRHRLEEKLEHTRFLSDSLFRFVRKEKKWLAKSNTNLQAAFDQLMQELSRSRFIDARVSDDVRKMIAEASDGVEEARQTTRRDVKGPLKSEGDGAIDSTVAGTSTIPQSLLGAVHLAFGLLLGHGTLNPHTGLTDEQFSTLNDLGIPRAHLNTELKLWTETTKQSSKSMHPPPLNNGTKPPTFQTPQEELAGWRVSALAKPPGHCASCSQPILWRVPEGIHCSSPSCPTSSVWFHLKCVKLKKRRTDWVCRGCRAEARLKMVGEEGKKDKDKGKGKERALD